jgi:hypothetical protein
LFALWAELMHLVPFGAGFVALQNR